MKNSCLLATSYKTCIASAKHGTAERPQQRNLFRCIRQGKSQQRKLDTNNSFRWANIVVLGFLVLVSGCGKPKMQVVEKPKMQAKELRELKGAITGAGWHIPWSVRDPKHPNGKPIKVLIADAEQGALKNDDGNIRMGLENARVKLFQDGAPTANINAKILSANRDDNVVIGTGGVVVNSLQKPPNTVITAEKMVWDTATTKVIAVGNAQVKHRLKNGTLATSSGGRVTLDIRTEEIEIE